ncbi:54S ribosomal protein L3 [Cichlidogyrus casuarinus]|uniref:Large ribosomal subunit protein uL3m n=1 Tax=Cichlidogyrus casuarinus TaxID=1844966 RepID=A0ABD2PRU2_9PLAT
MKIVRGKREAGLMGNRYRTSRGRLIVRMNPRLGLIYVVGPTPGPVHSFCYLNDSWLCNIRHELDANPPPVPTWYPSAEHLDLERKWLEQDFDDDFQFDLYHEMLHRPDDGTIRFPV